MSNADLTNAKAEVRCHSPNTNNNNNNHSPPHRALSPTAKAPLTAESLATSSTSLPTLQGYLLKHNSSPSLVTGGGNVVVGGFRRKRWFVFSPVTGKLYYYRTREDLFPLGEIDIRSASFVIKSSQQSQPYVQSVSSAFVFEIVTGTKALTLEASNAGDGFYWVKNLQIFRQHLCNKYLGLDNETNNNHVEPLQFDLSHQTNLAESKESPKSPKVTTSTPLDNSQSQSIFYICDSSASSTSPSSPQDTSAAKQSSPTRRLGSSDRASSLPEQSASSETGAKDWTMLTGGTRPKLFSGIVNRIRPTQPTHHSVTDGGSAQFATMDGCGRCKRLEEQLITLNHDRYAFEDEMKTNREVIKILQEQLRIFNSEKASFDSRLSSATPATDAESLTKEVINLKIQVKCLQKENEKLHEENRSLSTTKSVLEEMLESRDRTLVSLTHEVYDLESKNSRMATRAELEREYMQDEMPRKVQQRIEQLEDTVVAFEQQNEFLNKEIIELNDIRHRMELKEKQSQAKLCEVEAKCSQIQSKLLSLLKELNQCIQDEEKAQSEEFHNQDNGTKKNPFFVTNESVKLLVSRLLEESSLDIPLSWKPGNRPRNWSVSDPVAPDWDELGFFIRNADTQTYDLVLEPDKNEIAWRSKWDQFISNMANVEDSFTLRSVGLKQMLRLGVPQDYRCKIWRMLINQRVKEKRARLGEDYYESLLRANHTTGSPLSVPETRTKVIDPSAKQIELDLLRTLPNNKHFENLESDGIARLRRVLVAYSLHNRTVGYCQGLNRLAAVALLFMPEEDAFWCLVAIVETIMPQDYFGRNLMGAHVDQYVLRELITEKLPQLSQHMEQHHIEISLFAWFLTVFVDNIPTSVYLHIWDVFLYEGSKVLFRFALAILKMHEADLLQLKDSASFNQYLRTLDERHFNLKRLSEIAFRGLNPFSSSKVQNKRNHYTTLVMDELRKIEQIRDQISTQRDCRDGGGSGGDGGKPEAGQSKRQGQQALISFDDNDSD